MMQREYVDLVFVGDIMQHERQLEVEAKRGYTYTGVFDRVKHLLPKHAFVIGNLETTIGDDKNSGFPKFSAPPEFLSALKDAGFNILVTCNNHSLDKGETALLQTETRIQELGMQAIGTRSASTILAYPEANIKIKLQVATCIMNDDGTSEFVKFYKAEDFVPDETADANIAYIHCGEEYNAGATRLQKRIRRELLSFGWDAVLFVHSHVIGNDEVDTLKRQYVSYGLGNFLSDQKMLDRQIGRVLKLRITKKGLSKIVKSKVETVWNADKTEYYIKEI